MKIILTDNIKHLGKKGELKEVSEGYARNFLFPKKLAEIATTKAIEELRKKQEEDQKEEEQTKKSLQEIANKIQGKKITIKAKAEKEKLFGSIGPKEISIELKKEGFNINEKSIILKDLIKSTGEKEIIIDFGKNIKTKITVLTEKA